MANEMVIARSKDLREKLNKPSWTEALMACVEGSPDEKRVTASRLVMHTMIACQREHGEKLLQCDPLTILRSLMECGRWGLEPDGRHAALVPYKSNCQLLPMKEGLIRLALEHPKVATIEAEAVFKLDKFVHVKGLVRKLRHVPFLDGDPGELRAAYAIAFGPDGAANYKVIGPKDANRAKQASASARNGGGPWFTDEPRMWEKTAVKRLVAYLPRGRRLGELLEHDQDEQAEADRVRVELGRQAEDAFKRAEDDEPRVTGPRHTKKKAAANAPGRVLDLPPPSAADELSEMSEGEPEGARVPAPAEERGAASVPPAGAPAPAVPASPPAEEVRPAPAVALSPADVDKALSIWGRLGLQQGQVANLLAKASKSQAGPVGSTIFPRVFHTLVQACGNDANRATRIVEGVIGRKLTPDAEVTVGEALRLGLSLEAGVPAEGA